ncbi:metal-dependent hydrolase [Sphingomonas crocodyli]|uniref:Metal-dependent hydrolase n=1 Tax=Sphingomonas crocodyli TaxID=1979270 RepID=A0A437LY09_9SPHN|nr:metal-dependent hydrolase [Sphingomonas crocodyli]RVT90281.1 metal-dependent hydrolase [Sphingomonas crocodyli]
MTDLKLRKIPFVFDDVAFIWNPQDPGFSVMMNKISFLAVGFEKYICRAVQDAEARITDPAVLAEAKAFRAQESIHSLAHKKHLKALIRRYPGLQETLDKVVASYDELYEAHPLEFHLGYVGGLESVFTPFFKLLIDHRDKLFAGGDTRVASLMLWHFCEEIEHRSSGLIIYDHVVGRYLYRIANYRRYMAHSGGLFKMMGEEFVRHIDDVPADILLRNKSDQTLPFKARMQSLAGVLAAQLPWHDPVHEALPDYFAEWTGRYDRGEDMTRTYGATLQAA